MEPEQLQNLATCFKVGQNQRNVHHVGKKRRAFFLISLIVHQLGGLYGSLKGNKQNMYNLNP